MHLVLLRTRCFAMLQEEILSSVDSGRRASRIKAFRNCGKQAGDKSTAGQPGTEHKTPINKKLSHTSTRWMRNQGNINRRRGGKKTQETTQEFVLVKVQAAKQHLKLLSQEPVQPIVPTIATQTALCSCNRAFRKTSINNLLVLLGFLFSFNSLKFSLIVWCCQQPSSSIRCHLGTYLSPTIASSLC